jgi:hypothetical protein
MGFLDRLPPHIRGLALAGGALMSAFSSHFPDALQQVGLWLGIVISVGAAAETVRHYVVERRRAGLRLVEPHHLILAGLVLGTIGLGLVAGGFAWQTFWPTNTSPASGAQRSTAQPAQKTYFAADINARIAAIDRMDTIVVRFQPLLMQSQEFWNRIRAMIQDGSAADLLTKCANDAKPLLDETNAALLEYRTRFPEIETAIVTPELAYVRSIPSSSPNLRAEIAKWAGQPNAMQTIENTRTYAEWDRAIHSVQPWMEAARDNLRRLRQKYEQASVYDQAK